MKKIFESKDRVQGNIGFLNDWLWKSKKKKESSYG